MPSLSDSADLLPSLAPDYSQHPNSFHKAHINTMLMPTVNKFWYLVQACCTLSSLAKWHLLQKENEKTIGGFIFEDILCRWGGIMEIVNNGPTFVAAAGYLAK